VSGYVLAVALYELRGYLSKEVGNVIEIVRDSLCLQMCSIVFDVVLNNGSLNKRAF